MKTIKKYWWVIVVLLLLIFRDRIFKKKIKRGDNNEHVKQYQTILQQLLVMTMDTNNFENENAITEVYRFQDILEELSKANKWSGSPYSLPVNGNFDHKTETIGLELKKLYSIPGIANEVDVNEVNRWFKNQNAKTLENALL